MEIRNEFHGTSTTVRPHYLPNGRPYLTARQAKETHRKLCGSVECTCGDVAGARPYEWTTRLDGIVIWDGNGPFRS